MENKKSNNNIILIIIGLILVAGVSLFVGMNIGNSNNNNNSNVSENNEKDNNENKEEVVELDEVTALTLVQHLYDKAMEFYTYEAADNCTWKTNGDCIDLNEYHNDPNRGESDGYIEISNYDEIMNNVFTKKGLNQFENFMQNDFSKTEFLKEKDGKIYILIPTSGFYTGYATKNLKITNISENEIQATIDVVDAFAESEGSADAVKTKNIIVKKENNKWLVEEFAIPMHY